MERPEEKEMQMSNKAQHSTEKCKSSYMLHITEKEKKKKKSQEEEKETEQAL